MKMSPGIVPCTTIIHRCQMVLICRVMFTQASSKIEGEKFGLNGEKCEDGLRDGLRSVASPFCSEFLNGSPGVVQ